MLMADSQEGETFYWSLSWVQRWTYQKCITNSAHKQHVGDLPYEFNNVLPVQKYDMFLVKKKQN